MGFTSFLKSPKKEELEQHEVPDTKFVDTTNNYGNTKFVHNINVIDQEVDIMDDLERILGINDVEDQKLSNKINSWEFMDWNEFRELEDDDEDSSLLLEEEEERDQKLFGKEIITKCFFEEEGYNSNFHSITTNNNQESVVKREVVGFWDEDYSRVALNLSLNYQEVLDAWSDRGSLWADRDDSTPTHGYMGEVPVMEEDRARREASVMRYKEKRQTRLFSKKIRYEVRKLNADKRPRLKGRFVKRGS